MMLLTQNEKKTERLSQSNLFFGSHLLAQSQSLQQTVTDTEGNFWGAQTATTFEDAETFCLSRDHHVRRKEVNY